MPAVTTARFGHGRASSCWRKLAVSDVVAWQCGVAAVGAGLQEDENAVADAARDVSVERAAKDAEAQALSEVFLTQVSGV